jgi:hypothetical protein
MMQVMLSPEELEALFSETPSEEVEPKYSGKKKKRGEPPKEGEDGWINPLWEEDIRSFGRNENAARAILQVKSFRSSFRKDMRDRIVKWLDTPTCERQYASPLSWRQWECIQPFDVRKMYRGY